MPPPIPPHHFPVPWQRAAWCCPPRLQGQAHCNLLQGLLPGAAERWGWAGRFADKWMSTADHHNRRWWPALKPQQLQAHILGGTISTLIASLSLSFCQHTWIQEGKTFLFGSLPWATPSPKKYRLRLPNFSQFFIWETSSPLRLTGVSSQESCTWVLKSNTQ